MKTFPGIVQLAYSALTYPRMENEKNFLKKCDIFLEALSTPQKLT